MKDFIKKNLSLILALVIFIVGSLASVIIGFSLAGEGTPDRIKTTKTVIGGNSEDDFPDWFDPDAEDDESENLSDDFKDDDSIDSSDDSSNSDNSSEDKEEEKEEDTVKTYKCRYDKILDEEKFIYGVNAPWFGFHAQSAAYASNNYNGYTSRFNSQLAYADLYNMKALGFSAVNLWFDHVTEGVILDKNGYVTGLKDEFVKNTRQVLEWAKKLDLGLSITMHPHLDNIAKRSGKSAYDRATSVITNEKIKASYIKNAIIPMLKMIKEYEPWIVSIWAYCEPELDIYTKTGSYSWGTTQEIMNDFIGDMKDASKSVMPNIPVGIATLQNVAHNYNNVGLDFLGYDVYNSEAYVPDIEDQMSTTPMFLTEFACNDTSVSEETRAGLMYNMYQSAKEKGYVGAYFWDYDSGDAGMVEPYTQSEFTLLATTAYNMMLDARYEREGIDVDEVIDKPVWLAYDSSKTKIYFIASRQAEKYKIERSKDKKNWTVVEKSIDLYNLDIYGNGVCEYKDLTREFDTDYWYRVTAFGDDESVVSDFSDTINYAPPLGSGPDNLVKDYSFETGKLSSQWVSVAPEFRIESGDTFGAEGSSKALVFSQTNMAWKQAIVAVDVEPGKTYSAMLMARSTNWAGEFQWWLGTSQGGQQLWKYTNGTLVATSGWEQFDSDTFTVPEGVNKIYLTIQARTHEAKNSKGGVLTIFDNIYIHKVK